MCMYVCVCVILNRLVIMSRLLVARHFLASFLSMLSLKHRLLISEE